MPMHEALLYETASPPDKSLTQTHLLYVCLRMPIADLYVCLRMPYWGCDREPTWQGKDLLMLLACSTVAYVWCATVWGTASTPDKAKLFSSLGFPSSSSSSSPFPPSLLLRPHECCTHTHKHTHTHTHTYTHTHTHTHIHSIIFDGMTCYIGMLFNPSWCHVRGFALFLSLYKCPHTAIRVSCTVKGIKLKNSALQELKLKQELKL
jgi:hypothetical protein